eukprot:CAMPEP_0202049344 /NCGR_PEP_ID=MMETSP0963-20130614/3315_1 /ASSEMBLY_ACC=CAM_ASM_000494 /TAXON_ID=4773 /ORGANISM="Schizochytrium aggregatum, Strain ATCC28209" /LENGTH=284 /DNA_ID=CAMNT_0048614347 /DNA_START=1 /DNA_END=855 /DNA_ORIENTATION=+
MATPATREAGNEALLRGEFGQAVEIYTRALSAQPEDAKLLSNRSLAFYRLSDWGSALRDAEETIRVAPDWEKGYIRKALVLEKLCRPPQELLACYELGISRVSESDELSQAVAAMRNQVDVTKPRAVTTSPSDLNEGDAAAAKTDSFAGASAAENSGAAGNGAAAGGGRLTWDEEALAQHAKERGVLYGRMKIDQPDTPFLVYDAEMAGQHKIGTVKDRNSQPEFVDIADLQRKLGLLQTDPETGRAVVADKTKSLFEQRRADFYRAEGEAFGAPAAPEARVEP